MLKNVGILLRERRSLTRVLTCHFNTRVNEHLFRDKNSHIFKLLSASTGCRDKCDIFCFKSVDHASTQYSQLKIEESFHIEQLNKDRTQGGAWGGFSHHPPPRLFCKNKRVN